jgi:hypothetical protein
MNDELQTAIGAALEEKPVEFSDAIKAVLASKVQSVLEKERMNQASKFFGSDDSDTEEDEESYSNEEE